MNQATSSHHWFGRRFCWSAVCAALLVFVPKPVLAATYNGPITVHPQNRRYFMYGDTCEAVYLAGTHHRQNLQDADPDHYPPQTPHLFDFNVYPPADAPNANFIRGWHWEHSRWVRGTDPGGGPGDGDDDWIWPLPFMRSGAINAHDGKPKFDLYSYDPAYTGRLQDRAGSAQSKGMILSVMLFQGFSVEKVGTSNEHPEYNHPLKAENNTTAFNGDWSPSYPGVSETHTTELGNLGSLKVQSGYMRSVLMALNGFKGLFWEVSNESNGASLPWQNSTASTIRNLEQSLANHHLVWISHPRNVTNEALFGSNAEVISPSWNESAVKASGALVAGTYYRTAPPATSGSKIVILDTDHLGGEDCEWCDAAWVWKAFTRGYHVALLDDDKTPPTYPTQRRNVRRGINDTRAYAKKIRLIQMAPQDGKITPCSTGYCLYTSDDPDPLPYSAAVPNFHQFMVFKPSSIATVTIKGLPAGSYTGEWLRVPTSEVQPVAFTHGGGDKTVPIPTGWSSSNAMALWIKDGSTFSCQ